MNIEVGKTYPWDDGEGYRGTWRVAEVRGDEPGSLIKVRQYDHRDPYGEWLYIKRQYFIEYTQRATVPMASSPPVPMKKEYQEVLEHAIGVGSKSLPPGWRNRYCCPDSDPRCETLVACGLMIRGRSLSSGSTMYHVTKAGFTQLGLKYQDEEADESPSTPNSTEEAK